jgi:hypothetical protein
MIITQSELESAVSIGLRYILKKYLNIHEVEAMRLADKELKSVTNEIWRMLIAHKATHTCPCCETIIAARDK